MPGLIAPGLCRSFVAVLGALVGLIVALTAPVGSALAATVVVDTTADPGGGADCSLRDAITSVNQGSLEPGCTNTGGAFGSNDRIEFRIGPPADLTVRVITPTATLPTVNNPVTIDGYTQYGASPNTTSADQGGSNAAIRIAINGNGRRSSILVLDGGASTVSGLSLYGVGRGRAAIRLISAGNTISGNFIGVDPTGAAAGNADDAIGVEDDNNTIGGISPAARNVLSSNDGRAISIGGDNNQVLGNLIGTAPNGTTARGNKQAAITILPGSTGNTIGGAAAGARNVISGNDRGGIRIDSATGTSVVGNFIGVDVTGAALSNGAIGGGSGIRILDAGASNNVIGPGNVVSGNANGGVTINNAGANNVIRGNFIGTLADGTTQVANGLDGVVVENSPDATVGGTSAGDGNVIAGNGGNGILLLTGNPTARILGNRIFANGLRGIDLNNDGVTLNDPGDTDGGPNALQNFPVLQSAFTGAGTTVTGTLDSLANTSFRVELFSNPSCDGTHGEGRVLLDSFTVGTNGSGAASFTRSGLPAVTVGQVVTATATNASAGVTSEFSACRIVATAPDVIVTPTSGLTTTEAGGTATFTVRLATTPTSVVTIPVSSSDTTEGTVNATTLTFQPDATALNPQTVTVTGVDDTAVDGNVAYTIILGTATSADPGYSGINPSDVTATNQDNDVATGLSISGGQIAEGNSGTTPLPFTVTLSPASGQTVTVQYATSNGSATGGADCGAANVAAGVDFQATSGTLTFAAGETSKTVSVLVCGDVRAEGSETVTLTLSNPTGGATVATSTATGTILDDDGAPTLAVGSPTVTTGADGTRSVAFTVQLVGLSAQAVTVQYAVQGPPGAPSGTLTFQPGETSKTVTATAPATYAGGVTLTLTGPNGATIAVGSATTSLVATPGLVTPPALGLVAPPGPGTPSVTVPVDAAVIVQEDDDKTRKETEEQKQQRQRTNRSNRDDVYTEGNVVEVGRDDQGPFVVIGNRDGRMVVRLQCGDQCPTIRVGNYIEVDGTKENEQLFYAEEVSVSKR